MVSSSDREVATSGRLRPRDLARSGRYRHFVVCLLLATMIVGFLDRSILAALLTDADFLNAMEINGDPARQGMLATAALVTYAVMNPVLGAVGDWIGVRRVLVGSAVAWGGLAVLMGLAGAYWQLMLARAGRGLADSPLFPMMNRGVRNWFPAHERGRANAVWLMGGRLGPVFGLPLSFAIISTLGWRAAFFAQAVLSLGILAPALYRWLTDRPEQQSRLSARERAVIAGSPEQGCRATQSWLAAMREIITLGNFWICVGYHVMTLSVYVGLAAWLPKYFTEARGFSVVEVSFFGALPWAASALSTGFFGIIVDRYDRHGLLCFVGVMGTAVGLAAAILVPNSLLCALLFALGMFFWGFTSTTFYAIFQRIAPTSAIGTASGLDNGLANVGAAMMPAAMGYLIAVGGYVPAMLLVVGVSVVGAVFALGFIWRGL